MLRTLRSPRLAAFVLCAVLLPTWSFGQTANITSGGGPTIEQARQESALGPKARIAVARFRDKTGKGQWTGAMGDGMADMLTTILFNTNRFIVLERQAVQDVLQEQNLGASGRVTAETAAPIGKLEGAELLVMGAVTEFEPGASGGGGSVSGGGLPGWGGAIFGAITGGFREAHLAIDLRLVDTKTSRVLAATTAEGSATDINMGGLLGGWGSGVGMAGGLGGYSKTPMEKAVRVCLTKAVEFIVAQTPPQYYRYQQGQPVAAPMPGVPAPPPGAAPPPPPTLQPAAATPLPPAPAASGKPSVEERLKRLDDLKSKGLLNDQEYKAKRDEILKDL